MPQVSIDKKLRILIVEDDIATNALLAELLRNEAFQVIQSFDGDSGMRSALNDCPDLVVLDWDLPRMDGPAVCEKLRSKNFTRPILFLTGKTENESEVQSIESGADDFIRKPADPAVFLARVHSLLRRVTRSTLDHSAWRGGNLTVDLHKKQILKNGAEISLNAKEFGILDILIRADGAPVSRERFLAAVWNYEHVPETRTVDNYISSLRGKIEDNPKQPRLVRTRKGFGYFIPKSLDSCVS